AASGGRCSRACPPAARWCVGPARAEAGEGGALRHTPVMHPRNREVQDALEQAGIDSRIVILDEHARTAVLAATQLGCDVAAIANSLVFRADGEPLLVMASGAARVDTDV